MKAILLLSGLGVLALFAELFKFRKALFALVVLGLLGTIATAISYWKYDDGDYAKYFGGMVDFGHSSVVMSTIMLGTTLLWFIMSSNYLRKETSETDHTALILFALVGGLILTCYTNLVMLFLGIEILSIPLYVLAGSRKNELGSNEAAFKYFLLGAFASGFLLFGIALIFGATGTFDMGAMQTFINDNADNLPGFFYGGIIMLLVGLLFKISAAPFHFWAPDVYQGSPTVFTAFMSTVVKTAAIVAILRLFHMKGPLIAVGDFWIPILAVCVGLTFIIGNFSAAIQTSVKRMFAFSSISHAGFLLLAIVAASAFTPKAIIYYTMAYSVASIVAFTVLINIIKAAGSDNIDNFNGLGKKSPLLAVAMSIALLSLAGIPPTAGFFAKYYVLTAAIGSGHMWLAIIGILTSLIGVYYYFRIIIAMYFKEPKEGIVYTVDAQHQALLFVTAVATIVLGLLPDLILSIGVRQEIVDVLPH